jgi:hypothetical protein
MKRVVPATRSLLSMLPAWTPGGPLLMRPIDESGASPMMPKNGLSSATTTPFATSAVFAWRSIGMMRVQSAVNSSGSAPV